MVLFFVSTSFAADYYVAIGGDDDDSVETGDPNNGTDPATPWATIEKVNNSFFQPGDIIHFKCGDEWREQLNVPSSGTYGNPIKFTSYGNDCDPDNPLTKPVINAAAKIDAVWSSYPGNINIYVAAVNPETNPKNLIINNTFDRDVSDWSAWPGYGNPDDALVNFVSNCDFSSSMGGCLKFTSSPSVENSLARSNKFSLKPGESYQVKFKAFSENNFTGKVGIACCDPYLVFIYEDFETNGTEYEFTFTVAENLSEEELSDLRVTFRAPNPSGDPNEPPYEMMLDDVSVKPVNQEPAFIKQLFVDENYLRLAQYPNLDNDYGEDDYFFDYLIIDDHSLYADEDRTIPIMDTDGCGRHNISKPGSSYLTDNNLNTSKDLVGAGIHIHTDDGFIEDRTVSAFNKGTHELSWINENKEIWQDDDTSCPINVGEGYYLDNKLWMLDQPGEWFYDEGDEKLYVWLPDDKNPSNHEIEVSVYDNSVDVTGRVNVVIDNLRIKNAAVDGIDISLSKNIDVIKAHISDSGRNGINIYESYSGSIQGSVIENSVNHGIYVDGWSSGTSVSGNQINSTGTFGPPKNSKGAIRMNTNHAYIIGNKINDSSYHGIYFNKFTSVQDNVIERACLVLNDCGGIYTWNGNSPGTPSHSDVTRNIVIDIIGNWSGMPETKQLAKGIYLDDFSHTITVENNTVVNASYTGLMLHGTEKITATGNTFYGNELAQLFLKTGGRLADGTAQIMIGNTIENNILFPLDSDDHVRLREDYDNIDLGYFSGNIYSTLYSDYLAMEWDKENSYLITRYTLNEWNDKDMVNGETVFDPFEFDISPDGVSVEFVNLIMNSSFDDGDNGWDPCASCNEDEGYPAFMTHITNCNDSGGCLGFTSGSEASDNHLSSKYNTFSLESGITYMLEFKAKASICIINCEPDVPDSIVVRILLSGGVGLNKTINVGNDWHNYRYVFTANQTLDDVKVMFYLPQGAVTVFIDEVNVSEVTAESTKLSEILINKTGYYQSFDCPYGNEVRCSEYIDLDGNSIDWSNTTLAPYSSKIIVWSEYPLIDSDYDGVLDDADNCPEVGNPFQVDMGVDADGTPDTDGDGYSGICGTDCNDNDVAINPDATEICDDGIDNNCDGIADICNASDWYEDPVLGLAWDYKQAVTINSGMTTKDLENFPVLIKITDQSNLVFVNAQADGDDIVFTDSAGAKLDHEIEKFDLAAGELAAWVKLPVLSASADTLIYMYYDNEDINLPEQQNKEAVWDSNYVMVQHLSETTGRHFDSTSYGNSSGSDTESGVTVTSQGQEIFQTPQGAVKAKIGGADEFDGVNDFINIRDKGFESYLDLVGNTSVTYSAWIYSMQNQNNRGGILSKNSPGTGYRGFGLDGLDCYASASYSLKASPADWWHGTVCSDENAVTPNRWDYVVYTYDKDDGTGQIYVNGVQNGTSSNQSFTTYDTYADLQIGKWMFGNFDGFIDEVRISNTARSTDWIAAEYRNQNNPEDYIRFSTTELLCTDDDGDGYISIMCESGNDCNDADPDVYPGADKSCLTWTGNDISNPADWTSPANWDWEEVPDSNDYVIIPDTINDPVINSSLSIGSLTIETGASLTVNSSSIVDIYENGLVLDGRLTVDGRVILNSPEGDLAINGSLDGTGIFKRYVDSTSNHVTGDGDISITSFHYFVTGTDADPAPVTAWTYNYLYINSENDIVNGVGQLGEGTGTLTVNYNLDIQGIGGDNRGAVLDTNGIPVNIENSLFIGDESNQYKTGKLIAGSSVINVSRVIIDEGNNAIQAGSSVWNVDEKWENNGGTFNAGTSTVNLADSLSIFGDNTFYKLIKISGTGNYLYFEDGKTQTIENSLSLQGTAGNLLIIRSLVDGTKFNLNLVSSATQSLSYLDVKDSNASGGVQLNAGPTSNGTEQNNDNWTFGQ